MIISHFRGKPGNELQNLAMWWGVGDHPLLKVFVSYFSQIILSKWICSQGGSHLPIFPSLHIPWEQGHPWNQHSPHRWGEKKLGKDVSFVKRWMQVWMDDFKRLFYMHRPDLLNSDIGSVTNRLKFKQVRLQTWALWNLQIFNSQDLQCKPFSWFLKNVYPEKFILDDPKHVFAYGRLKNPTSNTCLDNLQVSAFRLPISWLVCVFIWPCYNLQPFTERRQGLVRPGRVRLPQLHGQRSVLLFLQEVRSKVDNHNENCPEKSWWEFWRQEYWQRQKWGRQWEGNMIFRYELRREDNCAQVSAPFPQRHEKVPLPLPLKFFLFVNTCFS